jgi:NADPH:quinone reductase-like Zn-dependent oxidoreductase
LKAIVQHRYGLSELTLRQIGKPPIKPDEVLVRVFASALHPDVWHGIAGLPLIYRLMGSGAQRPRQPIPGMDIAGIVESAGSEVRRFKIGDEVFGATMFMRLGNGGAFAEYARVREDKLAHKPRHVTFEEAASIPTSGMIALVNFRPHRIARDEHVLIVGAAGNVGSLALQMAKARGARVTAVDASEKLLFARSLGADHVIDYESEDFTRSPDRYDVILDVASTSSVSACKDILTPTGRYCMIGHDHFGTATGRVFGSIPRMMSSMLQQSFTGSSQPASFKLPATADLMETLRSQLAARELTPVIGKTFTLEEVPAAMRCLLQGNTLGRIAITVN